MNKQTIHKGFLVIIIIVLLISPTEKLPNDRAHSQVLDKILLMIARSILVAGIKELIDYSINNADSWNITDASNATLTGMAHQIILVPFEVATNAFKPVVQNVTNSFGRQTDEELIIQTAENYESNVATALQNLNVDTAKLLTNLVANGNFVKPWPDSWIRGTNGSVYTLDDKNQQIYIRSGENSAQQLSQTISIHNLDLVFSVRAKLRGWEEDLFGMGTPGAAFIGLEYLSRSGAPLGATYFMNMKSWSVGLNLPGAPQFPQSTAKTHYIRVEDTNWHAYEIEVQREVINNLPGVTPSSIASVRIVLGVKGTSKAGLAELYAEDIKLWAFLAPPKSIEITSVSPQNGPTKGGTEIAILGSGFDNGVRVTIGGVPAEVKTISSTKITAITPPCKEGVYSVTVTKSNGNSDTLFGIWNGKDWRSLPVNQEYAWFVSFALDDKGYAHISYILDPNKPNPPPFMYAKSNFPITEVAESPASKTKISLQPASKRVNQQEEFTLELQVSEVENLAGYEIEIIFNPKSLEFQSVKEGDFLKQKADTFFNPVIESGKIALAGALLAQGSVSGSGILATLTFKAISEGETALTLQNPKVVHPDGSKIAVNLEGATVKVGISQTRTLSITSMESSPGAHTTVQLSITDATGVASGDILVKYDANVVAVGEVRGTDLISDISLVVNKDVPGEIKLSMAGSKGIPSGSGAIAEIELTVSADAKVGTETTLEFNDTEIYDESGVAIPINLKNGVVKITQQSIKGDVNNDGKIRSNDAMLALRIAAGLMVPSDYQEWAADMNDDGKIRSNDAMLILRKAAGLGAPGIEAIATIGSTITVMLGEARGVAGENITVPLMVDNIHGIAGGDICIGYNQKVLRAVDVSSDSDVLQASNIAESGMVSIAFISADGLHSKTVAQIRFDLLADDVSPLTLQRVELYQSDARPIDSRKIVSQFCSRAILPESSVLLQNFPNPFNPETWIPFQLAQDADVVIRIYDVHGWLVRELTLGKKVAGVYHNKELAAYWDGKDTAGQAVSSGIYFYQLKAGDSSDTRKMAIVK